MVNWDNSQSQSVNTRSLFLGILIRGFRYPQVPPAPLETLVPSEAQEHLDLVAKTVDLERGARLEVRDLVDKREKQEHVYVCNAPNI